MEVKKSARVCTFVFVLMLMLLLSSMIGTTVGKKPDNPVKPGKPPSDLVPADFEIRIGGEGTQDITLDSPTFLDVQDEVGGYWLPRTEGKALREVWGVSLRQDEEED